LDKNHKLASQKTFDLQQLCQLPFLFIVLYRYQRMCWNRRSLWKRKMC